MKSIKSLLRGVLALAVLGGALLWGTKEINAEPNYFYMEHVQGTPALNISFGDIYVQYKCDDQAGWVDGRDSVTLSDDGVKKIYIRAKEGSPNTQISHYGLRVEGDSAARMNVGGNILTLLDYDGSGDHFGEWAFQSLFQKYGQHDDDEYPYLADASALILPDRTASYCYYCMFDGCTNLTKAPELPAETLSDNCYNSMFTSCKSLAKAPVLPGKKLVDKCYMYMFMHCPLIDEIYVGLTDLGSNPDTDTQMWLQDCAETGNCYNLSGEQSSFYNTILPYAWQYKTNGVEYTGYNVKYSGYDGADLPTKDVHVGDTVKFCVTPDEGYRIKEVHILFDSAKIKKIGKNAYSFVMPSSYTIVETITEAIDGPTPDPCPVDEVEAEPIIIDPDTFKSEAPSKTVIASNTLGAKSIFDLKVHAADDRTKANQAFLLQYYIGANAKILLTENIYPRIDLSLTENGSLQTLTWNNLPKNQPGAISAVVYNQIDGAYVISGILDANGTALFTGFKLRPASTITICR